MIKRRLFAERQTREVQEGQKRGGGNGGQSLARQKYIELPFLHEGCFFPLPLQVRPISQRPHSKFVLEIHFTA